MKIVAVVFGLTLFLAGAELGARLVFSRTIAYDVEMWRYASQLKVWGATPGIRFEHRKAASARLMGVDVEINSQGMRDRALDLKKKDGVKRVAVLGDSITFGWGVPQELTYPEVLEKRLNQPGPGGEKNRVEVLNFGVGNYNSVDELAMLRYRALAFQPDMILLGLFVNDAELASRQPSTRLLRHSTFAVWLWGRLDTLSRSLGWRGDYRDYYRQLYRPDSPGFIAMQQALQEMARLSRDRKIPLVVALIPELHNLEAAEFADLYRRLEALLEDYGLTVVDLHKALPRDVTDPQRFWVSPDDSHPNAEVQKLFAEQLYKEVDWTPVQ